MSGKKNDSGKPRMGLVPRDLTIAVAEVLAFGGRKYDLWNWTQGFDWSRVSDAALRHLTAWIEGEDLDPESGLSHLAHAACDIAFLIVFQKRHIGTDDRHKWPANDTKAA